MFTGIIEELRTQTLTDALCIPTNIFAFEAWLVRLVR